MTSYAYSSSSYAAALNTIAKVALLVWNAGATEISSVYTTQIGLRVSYYYAFLERGIAIDLKHSQDANIYLNPYRA